MAAAKVLIYDIETTPNLAYVWGKWQQDVVRFEEEWHMLSFAYKWLGEKQTYVLALHDFAEYTTDPKSDRSLVEALWGLFNEADIVIAHNGDAFDQKKSNARFLYYGLTPPEPYKSIDTLKVARRYFKFNSNKLGDLGDNLRIGNKAETGGFNTWLGCMAGDTKAWNKMCRYNKQDVVLLEKIYLKLRPWIDNHPGVNVLANLHDACPKCAGRSMQRRGTASSKVATYQRYQCMSCGGWSRSRVADKAVNKVAYV